MLVEVKDPNAPAAVVKCGGCEKVAEVALASLRLGVSARSPNGIALPACECGSQELLFRTFDGADDEFAGHRKAVNAIAIWLKGAGKLHPDAEAAILSDTRVPALTRPLIGPV